MHSDFIKKQAKEIVAARESVVNTTVSKNKKIPMWVGVLIAVGAAIAAYFVNG